MGTFQTAQTAGAGRVEVGVDVSETGHIGLVYPSAADTLIPRVGLSGRFGMLDSLDVMLRLEPAGLSAGLKWRVWEKAEWALSVLSLAGANEVPYENPGSQYADSRFASLSAIGDIPISPLLFGRRMVLVLSPKLHLWTYSYVDSENGPWNGTFLSAGGTVGVAIPVPVTATFRVMPEVGLMAPLAVWQKGMRSDLGHVGTIAPATQATWPGVVLQAGFAILGWGR